jgi:hypothetical protein
MSPRKAEEVVPKDNVGKAMCEEQNALFRNMGVLRIVKRRR